jgi:hypothetical protein
LLKHLEFRKELAIASGFKCTSILSSAERERNIGPKSNVNEESVGEIGRHSSAQLGLVHSDLGVVFPIV